MKFYDNGSLFTVSYNETDAESFADNWPASTVRGHGSFQFEKVSGDLVDTTGSAKRYDGDDWQALMENCKKYGLRKLRSK